MDAEQYYRVARQLILDKSPHKAEQTLLEGIELYPQDEKLYGELIALWNRSGLADQAVNLLNRLPEQTLGESDALRLRAQACIELGQWDQANELVQQLLHTSPTLSDAHRMMGRIHEHYGRWREAAECYRNALAQTPGHQ